MGKPINILFITADQWRGECLSALGHPVVKTPNLDALAADGVLFKNHFAQCTPCGPSRASLYTGMYMMNHRSVRNGTPIDSRFNNMALEVKAAGYEPGLIGYTDASPDPRDMTPGLTSEEDILLGFKQQVKGSEVCSAGMKPWLDDLKAKGYDVPKGIKEIYNAVSGYPGAEKRGPTYPPPIYSAEDSDTAFMVNKTMEAITQKTDANQPWFLHLSLFRPHPPFVVSEPYNDLYDPDDVPEIKGAASPDIEALRHPYAAYMNRNHIDREGMDPAQHPCEDQAIRQLRATYYGLMTELDHNMGRLIDFLKDSGEYDNTVIIFTSDHGDQLWDHWMLGKETYFDQSTYIPLIIRAPGQEADNSRGRVVNEFTETVDIMPTIMEMMGRKPSLQCDGASLSPFLAGKDPKNWRKEAHWEVDFRDIIHGKAQSELGINLDECSLTVIRDENYKYVHFTALPPLFFDLKKDPDENNNLANDPAYASKMLEYAQKMLSWRSVNAERTLTGIRMTNNGPIEAPRPK